MSFRFEGLYTCCRCKKEARVEVNVVAGLTFDDPEVLVKVPPMPPLWESDGLGGFMCSECFGKWRAGKPRKGR